MLDPDLQNELKNANKTVLFMHISMMSEPFIYIIIALVLKGAADFTGLEGSGQFIAMLCSIFVLISVLVVPTVVFLRRLLFSPERIVPPGADPENIAAAYSRAQLIIDALADVPATLGFVLFLISGRLDFLVVFSAESIAILALVFPRYETLEESVMARIVRGETIPMA